MSIKSSRIVVKEHGKIFVKFFTQHEGHGTDLEHLCLPRTTRESVAGKLKEGVTMNRILNDIQEEVVATKIVSRTSLLSAKDLHNNIMGKENLQFSNVGD